MAKFRLLSAHQMRHAALQADAWLPGDKENYDALGPEQGTLVGDGTPYPVVSATIEMVALDAEAEAMLEEERERLARNGASMNPVDNLPVTLQALFTGGRDDYEDRYIPGFSGVKRPTSTKQED